VGLAGIAVDTRRASVHGDDKAALVQAEPVVTADAASAARARPSQRVLPALDADERAWHDAFVRAFCTRRPVPVESLLSLGRETAKH
jgi:hypothetical protein